MTVCLNRQPGAIPAAAEGIEKLRIAVAQIGARRHYAVPRILEQACLLETFYTDLYAGAGWPARVCHSLPASWQVGPLRRLAGRTADIAPERVRQYPWFGMSRRLMKYGRNDPSGTRQVQLAANRKFGHLVAENGLQGANAVYVFNGAGLEILETARTRGLRTIVDQTSAPVAFEERIAREERERWLEWESGATPEAVWRPFADRERDEWQLADQVICGSEHVRNLVAADVPRHTAVQCVPYGIDPARFQGRVRTSSPGPLRVLFVGHLRLLKGVQYLAAAAERLNTSQVHIRIVGSSKLTARAEQELSRRTELVGHVSRNEICRQYDWADVFVLPSLSEGSAGVCYEALASGLPVITTPHSGSVVRDGVDGFIVPVRSADRLAEHLEYLASNRDRVAEMSSRALARSHDISIAGYSRRLIAALTES